MRMRVHRSLLPGLLLLAGTTTSWAQDVPVALPPSTVSLEEAAPSSRLLLKVGLNAARSVRWSGYSGVSFRLPVTVGAEYWLSPTFTLYGQLDADFSVRQPTYFGERYPRIPTGALSLGGRYYYNQAGRAQSNRAHGAFVGNYLAAELHTEMGHDYQPEGLFIPAGGYTLRRYYVPTVNLLWGMQRRLGHHFLFDANAGIGISNTRSNLNFVGFSSQSVNLSGQFNLGIYFGR